MFIAEGERLNLKNCSMCGKDFNVWDEQAGFCFKSRIGYGSIYDGEVICMDLCCECFDKIMEIIIPMCRVNPIHEAE